MGKKTERESRESTLASGWRVEAGAGDAVEAAHPAEGANAVPDAHRAEADPPETPEAADHSRAAGADAISNGALVILGVFGGLYLLYTWGWFIVAQAYSAMNAYTAAGSGSIGSVLQQLVFWAAPLAPALWFFVSLVVSRGGRTKRLALSLLVGAVVLVPLPMLISQGG